MSEPSLCLSQRALRGGARIARTANGFTLMELLIVVAIVGILAAIAYPSYREQVVRTRRATGTACLLEAAQFMERYYTTRMTFVGANPALPCQASMTAHYLIPAPAVATATAYTLTVVPQGAQAVADTKCGTMGINQAGIKTESGTATSAGDCW